MNAERKWTPGPWGMETVRTSCGVCHKIGPWPHKWRAGETMSACIYDDYPSPPEGTDTMLANAHLIAAAPDMYEALAKSAEGWANAIELGLLPPQHITSAEILRDEARAALSKAEGR